VRWEFADFYFPYSWESQRETYTFTYCANTNFAKKF
jgi:hypothetical protein